MEEQYIRPPKERRSTRDQFLAVKVKCTMTSNPSDQNSHKKSSSTTSLPQNSGIVIVHQDKWIDTIPLLPVMRIGRDGDNQIRLPSGSVSGLHCVLRWKNDGWEIADHDSSDGTFVNGEKLTRPITIEKTDTISVGGYELRIDKGESLTSQSVKRMSKTDAIQNREIPGDRVGFTGYFRENQICAPRLLDIKIASGFYQLAKQLSTARDEPSLANIALQQILQSTQTETGFIQLLGETRTQSHKTAKNLRSVAFASSSDKVIDPSSELLDDVLACGEGILAVHAAEPANTHNDASFNGAESMICVPIRHADKFLGIVHIHSQGSGKILSARDFEYCMSAAELLGCCLIELQNANTKTSQPNRFRPGDSPRQIAAKSQLLGDGEAMQELRKRAKSAADSTSRVYLHGETGTGKSTIAKWIHSHSDQAVGPFIRLNGLGVLEAETTDASLLRKHLQAAEGGTLFLDNVDELPNPLKAELTAVLETCSCDKDDSDAVHHVRIISSATASPKAALSQDKLNANLLFRINQVTLRVPPLRERADDFRQLLNLFISKRVDAETLNKIKIPSSAITKLANLPWPGNVRQLQVFVSQKLASADEIGSIDWTEIDRNRFSDPLILDQTNLAPLSEIENRYVTFVLAFTNGNKSKAAEILGISRSTLDRKTAQLDVPSN